MRTGTVQEMLAAKDWPALSRHFAENEPADAQEYQARAFSLLQDRSRPIDWPRVLADLRQACSLKPDDALLRVNLAQALLEARESQEAYVQAQEAHKLAPDLYPVIEKLALASAATQRWDEALHLLVKARSGLPEGQQLPQQAAAMFAQLASQWWKPLMAGGVVLRRPEAQHAPWLRQVLANEAFMHHMQRLNTAGEGADKLLQMAQLSPFQTRRIDWIVHDRAGNPRGLASLVDLNFPNRRGELIVGFPGEQPSMLALKAGAAALAVAFQRLGLHKVVAYVYADNPKAQAAALHFGFQQEGHLRSHIVGPQGRVDVFVDGMLRQEYQDNKLLKKSAARWRREDGGVVE